MSARILIGLVLCAGGCSLLGEPTPTIGSPNHHSANGLEFDYPGNWKLTAEVENTEGFELYTVDIESNGGALAMVQQFKPSLPLDADDLMADIVASLPASTEQEMGGIFDYRDGSLTDVERTLLGETRAGKEKHFWLSALGEKMEHTMQMYPVELEDRALVLYSQIPEEDRVKAQPGFDQIFDSLVLK